jgi:tetratricopeptide (TPR) repeat protein/transglutaminase-like putative cysteine protease
LLLTLLLTAQVGRAAVDWPVPRGASRELVRYQYDPAQWKNVPPEYLDDAPACVLYSGITYLVEADGTIETINHELTRLNSRKALQDLGEYRSIVYTPAYEKLTLNEALVHKKDGRTVEVKANHVQLRDSGTDYQVYDQNKQLVISYPSLEVGDVIEVKWTTRGRNPEHQGQFFTRYTFGADTYPIVVDEMRLRLPKDRVLKHRITGGKLEPTITEEGDNKVYHWKTTNLPQLPQEDHLPSKEDLRLQVSCSTFASWDEIYKWKHSIRKDCWVCTPEVRQIVQDVTKDLKTPLEKAKALTYWVRRHVRYISSGERHDYTPHPPAVVLSNRFGDCKDTVQLLAVMLKEAGVPCALATLGTQGDGQVLEDVPSPWGTHAILLVPIDGVDHWIDTTASLAGWDMLPRDDHDRVCYVTDEKGARLLRTPPLKPEDNRTEQTTRITIGADGSTRCERLAVYHGLAGYRRRSDWVEVPAGERRRQLTAELQDANSKSRLCKLAINEAKLKDYSQPVEARVVFEVLDQFGEDTDKPGNREGSLTDSKVWSNLLWYNLDYDRTVPMELDTPFESIHRYFIEIPPYFTLSADTKFTDREIKSKWGSFSVKIKADGDDPRRVEIEYRTRVEKVRVEPADFEAFHKFHDNVMKHYRIWVTLAPTKDPAQAPAIEAMLRLTPGDRAAAVILAELYLHNNKKTEARQVLQYARRYHPNHPKLAELAIQAAASLKDEEAVYRDLLKHTPTEYKYAVALAENLVEQSKHADARAVLRPVLLKGSAMLKGLAHYQLARSSFQENKAATALKHFESAEKADSDTVNNVTALRLKANICEKLDRPKDAAEAYQKVLDLDHDNAEALDALIRLELAADNRPAALEHLRRYSIAIAKDSAGLARAADYSLRLGRPEDALDLAARSIELGANALAERSVGLVWLQRGDFGKAAAHLEHADLDSAVLEGLVRSRLALGQLQQAVQDAEQADKVGKPAPELVQACQTTLNLVQRRKAILAEVNIPEGKQEQWNEAIDRFVCAEHARGIGRPAADVETLLNGSFANGVELGAAYGLRGILGVEKGRLGRALDDANRAINLSPKEAFAHYVRGRVLLERSQPEALNDLKKAAELSNRKDAYILHWLASALQRQGEHAQALGTQKEAVQLKPKDPELLQQLEEFQKAGK